VKLLAAVGMLAADGYTITTALRSVAPTVSSLPESDEAAISASIERNCSPLVHVAVMTLVDESYEVLALVLTIGQYVR